MNTGKCLNLQGEEVSIYPHSVSSSIGLELQKLMECVKPKVCLEVGCANGVSAMFICEKLKSLDGKKHVIIDPGQFTRWEDREGFHWTGLLNLEKCGFLSMVEFYPMKSQTILPRLLDEKLKVDFAFIDGFHIFEQVMIEFYYIAKMVTIGGYVVLDDAHFPAIQQAVRYIDTLPHFQRVHCENKRLAAFCKKEEDSRKSQWYAEF